jgi:hypothetical protein
MSEPAQIYLSSTPTGGLAVFSGALFGDDRATGGDPRRDLRARLKLAKTPKERGEVLTLCRQLGTAELTSHFERISGWTR